MPSRSAKRATLEWDHAGGLASRTNASEDSKLYQSEHTVAVVDTTGGYGGENDPAALFAVSGVFSSETNEAGDVVQSTSDIYGYRTSETDPDAPEDATTRYFRSADGHVWDDASNMLSLSNVNLYLKIATSNPEQRSDLMLSVEHL